MFYRAGLTFNDVVTNTRLILNVLGLRSRKVFAIGFNKTGTTSLHQLFLALGRPSYHGTEWRSLRNRHLLRKYDCFSDGIPADLAKLDSLFPESKFVLQVRDLEGWIYSRLAHIDRRKLKGIYTGGPDWDTTDAAVEEWIVRRNTYHLHVLKYFESRRDDLLVVNYIRDVDAATKVTSFLGYVGDFERPSKNVNPSKQTPAGYKQRLTRVLNKLGIPTAETRFDIYCPSVASEDQIRRYPVDTSLFPMSR